MLSKVMRSILFWLIAMICFAMFRFFGIEEELEISDFEPKSDVPSFNNAFIALAILGIFLGLFYALIDHFFEKYLAKRQGLGLVLLSKAILYFLATVMMISLVADTASKILDVSIDVHFGWWISDKRFWATMFYIIICSFVAYFINDTSERFGHGKFFKMLLGKYRNPKEEKIIFMFLDLRDSTTIAERLGHHKYSRLIQECFFDLNEVLMPHQAQIYQYVGDEAVVYWSYPKGLFQSNCIRLFMAFEQLREIKKDQYLEKYGVFPEFKAGVHGGKLIAVEVGQVKRELAYHGDVINTASRIQAECNKQNVNLLISHELLEELKQHNQVSSRLIGNILLKGKKEEIKIHSIPSLQ